MTNNSDDNIFLNFLSGVKPIKKTNKITKSLPKQKLVSKSKFKPKTKELNKPPEKKKHITTLEKLRIEKSSINRKLKKGKIKINKKIDFHGCSIEEAKELFLSTINECFLKNYRCILFITGKGINKKLSDKSLEKKLYFGKIIVLYFFFFICSIMLPFDSDVRKIDSTLCASLSSLAIVRQRIT